MGESLRGTHALVTGASSGIGAATALALAEQGAMVTVVARRADRLTALVDRITAAGGAAMAIEADVGDSAAATALVAEAVAGPGRLDILVNNAGVMHLGPVEDGLLDEWHQMVDVNITGLLDVTHAALPHLQAAAESEPRRVADLVNVGSIGGRRASPGTAIYNATKFAISGFTEALRQEITKQHVRVSVVQPGMTATEVLDNSRPGVLESMLDKYGRAPGEVQRLEAEDVADAIAYVVTRPRHIALNEIVMRPTDQV